MLAILRNRTYRHLFAAQVLALLGTGLMTVALGLLAYDLAGPDAGAVLGTSTGIAASASTSVNAGVTSAGASTSTSAVQVRLPSVRLVLTTF